MAPRVEVAGGVESPEAVIEAGDSRRKEPTALESLSPFVFPTPASPVSISIPVLPTVVVAVVAVPSLDW